MRKMLILIGVIASVNTPLFSQTAMEVSLQKKMDSLKKIVHEKTGMEKVDDLNRIVDLYQVLDDVDQLQVDSATPYAREAISEAKRIGYKRGLGYANLKMTYCEYVRNNIYIDKNKKNDTAIITSMKSMLKLALQIGEELGDDIMIGSAYSLSGWIENQKGATELALSFQKKAIASIEKALNTQPPHGYKEMEFTLCEGCNEIEVRLAWLFMDMIFLQKGNKENEQYLNRAISYYEKAGANSDKIGEAYMQYARTVGVNTNTETGLEYFKKASAYFQSSGNKQAELGATTMISASYWANGDFENGFEYSKKSVSLAEKIAKENPAYLKKAELGRAYFWMGRFYSAAGDYETALKVTRKGKDYFSENPGWKGNWSALMGDIYRRMKNYDSSMYYLSPFEKETESSNGKLYLAILYTDLNQYDRALPLINTVLENEKQKGNLGNLGHDYSERATIWLGKKDYRAALNDARKGLALLKQVKRNSALVDNYLVLSEVFNKTGRYDSAYYYLKQNAVLKDSLISRQFYIRLNDYKKETEEAKKEARLGFLNRDNKIKEQQLKQEVQFKKFLFIGLVGLLITGFFVFGWLSVKRKNEKLWSLQLENELKVQQLESEKKESDFEKKTTELEMQALRAQMNPHFIFNCLSSINRFILKNETKTASGYLTRFSRLMRMVLINSEKQFISLDDELQMLELYLEMERLRFKNSFDYRITFLNVIDSDNIFIPPLLLQPFCENAIWHGLMHREGMGRLDIELSMEDKILNCIITDNGVGRENAGTMKSKTAKKEKPMGLKITTERLALLNREKGLHTAYVIEDLVDEGGNAAGTKVLLKISFKESVKEIV